MVNKITREQFEELSDASYDVREYHKLLEQYTGIEANAYTAFSYFDSAGNYVGNSCDSSLWDLLRAAYVEVDNG